MQRAKIYGPYRDRGGYRVVVVKKDGREAYAAATPAKAAALRARLEREYAAPEPITIEEAITGFLASRPDLAPSTVESYRYQFKAIFPDHTVLLEDVTSAWCAKRYTDLQVNAAATHRLFLRTGKALFTWAAETKHIKESPWAKIKATGKVKKGKPQMRIDEARAWRARAIELAQAGQDGALAASLCLLLGLRAGEALSPTVRDLDNDGTILWVRGKTGERQREILDPELRDLLQGRAVAARAAGRFGLDRLLQVSAVTTVNKAVGKICRDVKVPVVCAHSLRGLWETLALLHGESGAVAELARKQGHSEKVAREHYLQPGAQETVRGRAALAVLQGGRKG